MTTRIRPRKDGGVSECNSPDDKVGKGRCCHILDESTPVMELSKVGRGIYEVNIGDHEDSMTIKAKKETIINFFNNLSKIDEEKQKKIIDFLQNQ